MLKCIMRRLPTLKNVYFYCLLICFSCYNQDKTFSKLIIGKWSRQIDEAKEPMPIGYKGEITYIFYQDSAHFYPGSYQKTADYGEFFTIRLLTNRADYKIKDGYLLLKYLIREDSIQVFDNETLKIMRLDRDTLALMRKDSVLLTFHRAN